MFNNIINFFSGLPEYGKYLIVFFMSMVPIVELRGAIPIAVAMRLNMPIAYAVAVLGNMIPVPFIYLFARRLLEWGSDKKIIGGACRFFMTKGQKAVTKIEEKSGNGLFVALFLFVGVPLPGTGAWTGTFAASLLGMKFKPSVAAAMLGVLLAGIIMAGISLGVFTAIWTAFISIFHM